MSKLKPKLIRITTVPISLEKLLGEQLTFMSQFFDLKIVSADKEELSKVGESLGVNTQTIEMTRQITPIKDLKSLWDMYRFLKREKAQIVHSHTPKAGLIAMLASKLAGVPYRMHTVAGLPLMETTGLKRQLLLLVEKLTYAAATNVYPNSKGLSDFILENKLVKSSKIKVIANGSSNGICTDFFNKEKIDNLMLDHLKVKLGLLEDDKVFIFVGRLVGDKGINELVEAFHNLSKTNEKLKLLLVGTLEEELDPLSDLTLEIIRLNSNIIHVGWQSDVRPYFAISDALVFPSYREGFPNVVMQAGAMGLPSIVSDINGCNEIINHEQNGIIVPPKNINALESAMLSLIENKELYNQLKNSAREMIVSRYEQSVVWDAILEEYLRLLSNQKK
ncbi:glycosyltransferase family 4 protein [Chryseobacterium sp. T1]